MNKIKKYIIFITFVSILGLFYYGVIAKSHMNYKGSTSGLVIDKISNNFTDYRIKIKVLSINNSTKVMNLVVKNENLWNLIEIDRTYFFTYSSKNDVDGVLEQIKINDDFGRIYKDRLKK